MAPLISIIIPVYNHAELTRQCLDKLLADLPADWECQIIVVDDASTDETPSLLAEYGERIQVLVNAVNAGFAVACNAGAAAASGQYLVFLNNDTIPVPGWLTALVEYHSAHPQAAIVGSRLLYPDGSIQHAGVVIGQDRHPWHIYRGFPGDHPAVMKSRGFQAVTGACILIPRHLFIEMNGFDLAFHNGFEDIDLCLRLGRCGYEIHYCHESVLYHLESMTRIDRMDEAVASHQLYQARWHDGVKPDDMEYYLADGIVRVNYFNPPLAPVSFDIDPFLLTFSLKQDQAEAKADDAIKDQSLASATETSGSISLPKQTVCVLGMHRSGTSLTARLLNLLGVDLGPDDQLMPALEHNPKGFWENLPIFALNEEILSQLGMQWDNVGFLAQGWENAADFADLRQRARQHLQQSFAQTSLWGWKDPRTCITLPFWQHLIGNLKYVICLRNPMDVAESLRRRNGFSLEKSAALWLSHVEASLVHTVGQPRHFVFYEDVLSDPQRELQRLANFLGLAPASAESIRDAADDFIERGLQHHATSMLALAEHPTLDFAVKAQFMALRFYVDSLRPGALLTATQQQDRLDALVGLARTASQAASVQAAVMEQSASLQRQLAATASEKEQALHSLAEVTLDRQHLADLLAATVSEKELALHSLAEVTLDRQHLADILAAAESEKEQALRSLADQEEALNEMAQTFSEVMNSKAGKLMQLIWKVRRTIAPLVPPKMNR